MKRVYLLIITIVIFSISLIGCSKENTISSQGNIKEDFIKSGSGDAYIELSRITNNIWVHTTYSDFNGSRTPSNGLIVVTSKGLVLIDTPWNNGQTRELLKASKNIFKEDIILAIITHAHEDRIGGIDTLLENKIDVRSTSLTAKEAEKYGFKKPQPTLDKEPKITIGDISIEVFYPGEGHTVDNITVWFPQSKVLFGGCLIKSLDSKDKGNTTDANVEKWPISVKKVSEKYSDAEIIIPGHGKWGGLELARHTLELVN